MFPVKGTTAHLAWYRTGEEPAEVAFLHGFTDSAQCWGPVIGALPEYRSLAIDARGHGASGLPEEPFNPTAHRDDVALVLSDQPRDGGTIVVGHSMGAVSAAVLAATRPHLVRALVLEDPPTGERSRSAGGQDAPRSMPAWLADLRALDLEGRIGHCRREHPQWPDTELEPWAVSKAQLDPHLFELATDGPVVLVAVLAAIACPVLLIHGDTERGSLISTRYAEMCAGVTGGEFRAAHVEDAGHSVHRDNPSRYLAELTAFLAQHR
ncbi:MAG: alpha/beta hydrolase [Actinocatenispora sp.]